MKKFDFQNLVVYQKAKIFYSNCSKLSKAVSLESFEKNQLLRAAFSVPLNIAEGSGKFSKRDRRNFFVISRASLFECIAILDILTDNQKISELEFDNFTEQADELSRVLYSMIKNLSQTERK